MYRCYTNEFGKITPEMIDGKVSVIEVDQFTEIDFRAKLRRFYTVTLAEVKGVSVDNARALFGGHFVRKSVPEFGHPLIGDVWYVADKRGTAVLWKACYDSSD